MQQELINIIEELRVTAHQVSHTYTREIAGNDMDADQWALLQDALKQINLKSQEAFLLVANLRRKVPVDISDKEYKTLLKALYPRDNSRRFDP